MPTLPDWVAKYVGIPYSANGRSMEASDCWGLIKMVLKDQFDIYVPDHENMHYLGRRNVEDVAQYMADYVDEVERVESWFKVPPEDVIEGDVILFRLMGFPIHVGIAVSTTYMLHQVDGSDSVVEEIFGIVWSSRIAGVYRYAR